MTFRVDAEEQIDQKSTALARIFVKVSAKIIDSFSIVWLYAST